MGYVLHVVDELEANAELSSHDQLFDADAAVLYFRAEGDAQKGAL